MKESMRKSLGFACAWAVLMLVFFACDRDNDFSPAQKERAVTAAKDNSQIIVTSQEVLAITEGTFDDYGISDGRAQSGGRFETIQHEGDGDDNDVEECRPHISGTFNLESSPDSLVFSGTLVIDFGDGSSCGEDSTSTKRGKLTDDFRFVFRLGTRKLLVNSSQRITFEGFSRGENTLDGVFTVTTESNEMKKLEFDNASITFEDGTSTSWEGSLTFVSDNAETLNQGDDTRTLTGSLSGETREGQEFSANITEEVVFKYACFKRRDIPVSGIVEITMGGTSSTLDFGDGRCDKVFTITAAGESTEHSF
jgi:hypothetical protein